MLTVESLSTKYRPKLLSEVVGQDIAVKLIRTTLIRRQVRPAYQFEGQRGNGKTTLARILACGILCSSVTQEGEPCLKCNSCMAFLSGEHPDFIEVDAASSGTVEDIRKIKDLASLAPKMGPNTVIVIDENHGISAAGQNSLLSIIEDSKSNVVFIFSTTNRDKVLPTLYSRCFDVSLSPVSTDKIATRLEEICRLEGIEFEEGSLRQIVILAKNNMREAIMLLDRLHIYGKVTTKSILSNFDLSVRDQYSGVLLHLMGDMPKSISILEEILLKKTPREVSLGIAYASLEAYKVGRGLQTETGNDDLILRSIFNRYQDNLLIISKIFSTTSQYLSREALLADLFLVENNLRLGAPLYSLISSTPSVTNLLNAVKSNIRDPEDSMQARARNPRKARSMQSSSKVEVPRLSFDQIVTELGGEVISE